MEVGRISRIPFAPAVDPKIPVTRCAVGATDAALNYGAGFFQIGTTRFISSINHWQAANASPR
jgi:hypothetical protein